jgi:hypothetical protein
MPSKPVILTVDCNDADSVTTRKLVLVPAFANAGALRVESPDRPEAFTYSSYFLCKDVLMVEKCPQYFYFRGRGCTDGAECIQLTVRWRKTHMNEGDIGRGAKSKFISNSAAACKTCCLRSLFHIPCAIPSCLSSGAQSIR